MKNIFIRDVDIEMLQRQRNTLLAIQDLDISGQDVITNDQFMDVQGLVNLIDHMLDVAEGYY